ncbi:MAG: hypothetical protein HYV65_02295, partial [Candidatus Spechtbacteria bacterium]|nr:hypothetical protein [Candidatus Spechtbacteria bacterium]
VMTNVTGIPVSALANGTDGELITWDASGVATTVAAGTAAQVLTSNGARERLQRSKRRREEG